MVCAFLLVKRMTLLMNLAILQQNTFNSKNEMRLKLILLTVIAIFAVCSVNAQEVKTIDFNYQKAFPFTVFGMDSNMNGKLDDGESTNWSGDSTFYIDHKFYGAAGSMTNVEVAFKSPKGKLLLKGSLEDVKLQQSKDSDGAIRYTCRNKLDELQFFIVIDKKNELTMIWVENPAFLKMVE